ncbi:MAG: diacylglycerol kinase family protein [Coriobacteriales bacterium]|jgi:diacylglycerol kinase|nr:diacylglycerol kinase family protein [Coriobacteriales bacterium]
MKKLFVAFKNAISGIAQAVIIGRNMRIHLGFSVFAIFMSVMLRLNIYEWCIIVLLCFFVLAAEVFNTAIEAAVDLFSLELHAKAKLAKDASAGAVLLLAIASVIIGMLVYINAFIRLLEY